MGSSPRSNSSVNTSFVLTRIETKEKLSTFMLVRTSAICRAFTSHKTGAPNTPTSIDTRLLMHNRLEQGLMLIPRWLSYDSKLTIAQFSYVSAHSDSKCACYDFSSFHRFLLDHCVDGVCCGRASRIRHSSIFKLL